MNYELGIMNSRRGFTLVELLLVIAIIGILSTLVMANFIGIRQRARDAQRKSDIAQIQSGLEFFRSDQQRYPTTGEFDTASCGSPFSFTGVTYMQKIPCDPPDQTIPYRYSVSGAQQYSLYACLENDNDSQSQIYPLCNSMNRTRAYYKTQP